VRAAAASVRAVEPDDARAAAQGARDAAARVSASDHSLGAGVIAHGVAAVADHALRAAAAREEDRKLAASARNHRGPIHVWRHRRQ
jgi:hypothetical protein